ncbi:hypothetical protein FRC08_003267 [Ceratobasidium sp. 394]|nr:hypothetical protein FRC08_003267 [Ceratobasidium sp. 394]
MARRTLPTVQSPVSDVPVQNLPVVPPAAPRMMLPTQAPAPAPARSPLRASLFGLINPVPHNLNA